MPWSRRPQEREIDKEDAELRDLMRQYARVHGHETTGAETDAVQPAINVPVIPSAVSSPSSAPSTGPKLTSNTDQVIQGESINYTKAEAKLYENEEPCDTWRHFDVYTYYIAG